MSNEVQLVEQCDKQLSPLESSIKALRIASDADYQNACFMDEQVRLWQKSVDEQRKNLTRPLDESKKRIMAMFEPAEEKAKALREGLRKLIMAYNAKKEEERKAEQAKLDAAAQVEADRLKEEAEVAAFVGDVDKHNELKTQAVLAVATAEKAVNAAPMDKRKFKVRYRFDVVDLSLVPRQYLCVDDAAVRKAINAKDELITIPGLNIYTE